MSTTRSHPGEADRLARVKLSCTIEPGDLRVTWLVSGLAAGKAAGICARRRPGRASTHRGWAPNAASSAGNLK